MMKEDEHFNRAFGGHTGISNECREVIALIKDNSHQFDEVDVGDNELIIQRYDSYRFTDEAWKLLGRYIANNTHLKRIDLDDCGLTDEQMALLFRYLISSVSLERLDLEDNDIGIEGLRSMIQFLQNSPKLSKLYFNQNNNVNSECFEVLVSALNRKSIKELRFHGCSITDVSALDRFNLPNLQQLNLNSNNIGKDGCITISNLIQKEGSTLKEVFLASAGIDNEGVEILATSLKHNTKLHYFNLRNNVNITEIGCKAFLTLLTNVSSIENTYDSNHTLTELDLTYRGIKSDMIRHINSAIQINKKNPTSQHTAGRAKVIKYQLDSQKRKDLSRLQEVEYSSIGNLFVDIELILLPNILALIGSRQTDKVSYIML